MLFGGMIGQTPTLLITNVARTYAPGAEGTALAWSSLLHNAAQAFGPVVYLGVEAALGWRAPWALMAAVNALYLSVVVATRFLCPLPSDCVVPSCDFEKRIFGCAPPVGAAKDAS